MYSMPRRQKTIGKRNRRIPTSPPTSNVHYLCLLPDMQLRRSLTCTSTVCPRYVTAIVFVEYSPSERIMGCLVVAIRAKKSSGGSKLKDGLVRMEKLAHVAISTTNGPSRGFRHDFFFMSIVCFCRSSCNPTISLSSCSSILINVLLTPKPIVPMTSTSDYFFLYGSNAIRPSEFVPVRTFLIPSKDSLCPIRSVKPSVK